METVPLTDEQQRIVEDNLALIYYVARDIKHVPEHVYNNIISRLHYRLCVCAQRFNSDRPNTISSYIVACLKGEIKNYFRDEAWIIRPPRKLREMTFSAAVDSIGDELSAAELHGENPQTIGSCAIPVPLHAIIAGNREDGEFELDVPSDEDLAKEVTDRLGGPLLIKEVMDALKLEERLILALQMKRRSIKEIEQRFGLSRSEAAKAWKETQKKAGRLYHDALDGNPLTVSKGNETIKTAVRRRFKPEAVNYLAVRERIDVPSFD